MIMLPTYFPSPPQGVWYLGPLPIIGALPIRAYALFIITGIVAALLIGDRRWVARGGERGVIYDIALWAVPFGLVGGRLYHLATDWQTYWGPGGAGFGAALRIWDGGLGIWGAVALGGVGAWIGCHLPSSERKGRRSAIPLPAFGDALAPGLVLAQAIGRLGNYFNQELYGRETTLPWGLEVFYRRDPSGYIDPHSLDGVSTGQVASVVQPTFLYELLWDLLVFVALLYIDRRFKLGHGRLFAVYVAGYCIGRFWVELLRDDTATHIAGIRINSFTSTFVFIGAVVYIILAPKGREDPESLHSTHYVADESAELEPVLEPASVASTSAESAEAAQLGATNLKAADADEVELAEPEAGQSEAEEPEAEELEAEEPEAEEPEAEASGESDVEAEDREEESEPERAEDAAAAEDIEPDSNPEAEPEESEDSVEAASAGDEDTATPRRRGLRLRSRKPR